MSPCLSPLRLPRLCAAQSWTLKRHYTQLPSLRNFRCSVQRPFLRHDRISSTVAAAAAAASEDAPVPSHWLEHLSHLRPGERRALNAYIPLVSQVNSFEPFMQQLPDNDLAALTSSFKSRLATGESLESLLPEAFAAVREAASRVLGMRHYDVQILGGIVLSKGHVAEMATGEGKTLVAALPAYLYALTGKGVHVVTVNDYLAQRDAGWIGKVLQFMGLSVGVVTADTMDSERRAAFASDVTYVTAYDLAFSFLHDNLAPSSNSVYLRRPLHYAVVDEVDSILIDEARNPFIITFPDPSANAAGAWRCAVQVANMLQAPGPGELEENWQELGVPQEPLSFDFLPDYRSRVATLTQRGMQRTVQALAALDQVILAIKNEESDDENLHVVLLDPIDEDGKLMLTIRPADGAYPSGTTGDTAVPSVSDVSTEEERQIVVESRDEVDAALSRLGLVPVKDVAPWQWAAAAPAALWAGSGLSWGRFINQAVRAVHLYIKDVHYIVKDGEVVIIDTATGREKQRSRWQAGVHQALEAKEEGNGIKIKPEDFDKGRTTYQSLFNLYYKLSGMTGTAVTEAEEFAEAYGMQVVRVPPHRPSRRVDNTPILYLWRQGWEYRIIDIVRQAAAEGRPVLLGTSSVEESEAVLELVSRLPFQAQLTEFDVRRLETALRALPPSLPPPDYPPDFDTSTLDDEVQIALEYFRNLMEDYENARGLLQRMQKSRRMTPDIVGNVVKAAKLIHALPESGLLLEPEVLECYEVMDVLSQIVRRSELANSVPLNLLNARPDRARKEAEIIAQAGLPGTVTVATAMAGRGTDILLGGNPKGLTLIALQHYFLPVLVPGARDLYDFQPAPPFAGLNKGCMFASEPDMKLHLPPALFKAFIQAKNAAKEAQKWNKSGDDDELLPGLKAASANPTAAASKASELLTKLLESVEIDRSVFMLMNRRSGLVPSLESALEWFDAFSDDHFDALDHQLTATERALRRYALLQWLWFDTQCEEYAAQVRAAGGLVTVITSIQDTRRTELQLRGRAGRQGDPGETFMVSHRNDPAVQSILSPAQLQGLWSTVQENSEDPFEMVPPLLTKMVLKTLTSTAEQMGLSAREQTRKYDAAIDPYRRHVFRLRRTLAGGGDAARGAMAHRQLRKLAVDLVMVYADPNKHPKEWKIAEILQSVQLLFRHDDGILNDAADGRKKVELAPLRVLTRVKDDRDHSTSDGDLVFEVQMAIESSAEELLDALRTNQPLPLPEIFDAFGSSSRGEEWLPVRRRALLHHARDQQQSSKSHLRGIHAPAAQRLQSWIGDLLTLLYEHKRIAMSNAIQRYFSINPSLSSASTPLHVSSLLRVWERDTMLQCLDALWTDFLQDVTTLQRAALSRAFSQFDPVDEFKLEAAQVFARLLNDFRRQTAVGLLAPVGLSLLEYYQTSSSSGGGGSGSAAQDDKVAALLDEVAWLADYVVETQKKNSETGRIGGINGAVMEGIEEEEMVVETPRKSTTDASFNGSSTTISGDDSDAMAKILGKLLDRVSQASDEDLSRAMQRLEEQRRSETDGNSSNNSSIDI